MLAAAPFSVGGQPIHPECVGALLRRGDTRADWVLLASCGGAKKGVERKGDKVTWVDDESSAFTQYEVVGQLPGGDWVVRWLWSGGGSGRFDGIGIFRLNDTTLRLVRVFAGGDRCNGGLVTASISGSSLKYSLNVTPVGVLEVSALGKTVVAQAHGLENSAMSCVGELEMLDGRETGLTLVQGLEDAKGWTEKFALQPCYNVLHREIAAKNPHLDLAGAEHFAKLFKARCVKKLGSIR